MILYQIKHYKVLLNKFIKEIKMIVDELSLHDPEIKEIH
jgi:hypothetical protein